MICSRPQAHEPITGNWKIQTYWSDAWLANTWNFCPPRHSLLQNYGIKKPSTNLSAQRTDCSIPLLHFWTSFRDPHHICSSTTISCILTATNRAYFRVYPFFLQKFTCITRNGHPNSILRRDWGQLLQIVPHNVAGLECPLPLLYYKSTISHISWTHHGQ